MSSRSEIKRCHTQARIQHSRNFTRLSAVDGFALLLNEVGRIVRVGPRMSCASTHATKRGASGVGRIGRYRTAVASRQEILSSNVSLLSRTGNTSNVECETPK